MPLRSSRMTSAFVNRTFQVPKPIPSSRISAFSTASRPYFTPSPRTSSRSQSISFAKFRLTPVSSRFYPSMAPSKEEKSKAAGQDHELEGEHNEWKFRAPYKVHENDKNFKVTYEGGCHCGKVKYQLSREKPLNSKYCHCTTCQLLHGAPFQWAAIFHKEDINFTHGHHDLGWYDSGDKTTVHKLPCKVSCAYCRTPIMDEGRNMILLFPTLIKFKSDKERENFSPSCHMFYEQRVVDIPDNKPKWSGMSGKSDLIADTPEEDIKKRKREVAEEKEKDEKEKKSKKDDK